MWVGLRIVGMIFSAAQAQENPPGQFPAIIKATEPNTQVETTPFTTPKQALEALRLPKGFQATLFAAEPMVTQPIAMAFDGQGRLWVAENNTYAESPIHFDDKLSDRVVVLEDVDGDGRADKRTVFWNQAKQLTSVELGLGGVWLMCPPKLLFLPDRNGDLKPDGPPEVILDGFTIGSGNRHNFANGLKWGPDGWLYGRHGITYTGKVGRPGDADADRTLLGPGIWRYHPIRRTFEVVCTGTTNPWGHDWDEHGELFFINTVIGHLWHAVPGAHFKRMFGLDPNPFAYELLDQNADHVHWDAREDWNIAKKNVSQSTDAAGGGHAHCGFMIYLGGQWPMELHNKSFTLNMHGRRVNCDRLERSGASYVGKHDTDLLFSNDPWFRGTELSYGDDGGVYIADWSDIGECHENDGVHRSSGRIFKVTNGVPRPPTIRNLDAAPSANLWKLTDHPNQWMVRTARRILRDRFAAGEDMSQFRKDMLQNFSSASVVGRLNRLWTLHSTGGVETQLLSKLLFDSNEHLSAWAVRLLVDHGSPAAAERSLLTATALQTKSGLVLLYLASALQKIQAADRWPLAEALARRRDFVDDRVLPRMIWYGIEAAVPSDPSRAADFAASAESAVVRKLTARRLTEYAVARPDVFEILLARTESLTSNRQAEYLAGIAAGLRGVRKVPAPLSWQKLSATFSQQPGEVKRLAAEIGVVFGDGRALGELQQFAADADLDAASRRSAIRSLVEARPKHLAKLLEALIWDKDVSADAIRGMAVLDDLPLAERLANHLGKLSPSAKEAAVETLASRPATAKLLLKQVLGNSLGREDVPLTLVRQMQVYTEPGIADLLKSIWPELRPIAANKQKIIADWKHRLEPSAIVKADHARGKIIWEKSCGKCHVLFGAGGQIGPDLTGSQRRNLDYLLENVVDPSATLLGNYRSSIIQMVDGRTVVGVVLSRNSQRLEVQTATEKITLPVADIERETATQQSLMPDGLFDVLSPTEVRDLVGYIQGETRAPRP